MNRPTVEYVARDEENNITFRVMAYRQLADWEALRVISIYLQNLKGPKKQNETITIETTIGSLPGM